MMLNRRLTGTLAWGGLILILAVPSAEMLSGKVDAPAGARAVAETDPVQTASIAGGGRDAVDNFLASGKPMPDYISNASETVQPALPRVLPATGTVTPAVAAKPATPPTKPAVQTAAIPPAAQPGPAPVPMPASMRPRPVSAFPLAYPAATTATPGPAAAPAPVQDAAAPVILDENEVMTREASAQPGPVPPASIPEGRTITEEDLADWDSGSLADYLQRRGLISDAAYGNEPRQEPSSATYDSDGFFLSDGPNENRRYRRNADDSFVVFPTD